MSRIIYSCDRGVMEYDQSSGEHHRILDAEIYPIWFRAEPMRPFFINEKILIYDGEGSEHCLHAYSISKKRDTCVSFRIRSANHFIKDGIIYFACGDDAGSVLTSMPLDFVDYLLGHIGISEVGESVRTWIAYYQENKDISWFQGLKTLARGTKTPFYYGACGIYYTEKEEEATRLFFRSYQGAVKVIGHEESKGDANCQAIENIRESEGKVYYLVNRRRNHSNQQVIMTIHPDGQIQELAVFDAHHRAFYNAIYQFEVTKNFLAFRMRQKDQDFVRILNSDNRCILCEENIKASALFCVGDDLLLSTRNNGTYIYIAHKNKILPFTSLEVTGAQYI